MQRHPPVARLFRAAPPRADAAGFLERTQASGPAAGRRARGLASIALAVGLALWIAFQSGSLGGVVFLLGVVAALGLLVAQLGFVGLVAPSVGFLGLGYVLADATAGHHLAAWTAIPYGIGAYLAAELAAWAAERRVNMAVEGRGSDLARWVHLGTVALVAAVLGVAVLVASGAVHSGGLALEAAGLVAAVVVVGVVVVLTARARSSAGS